LRPLPPPAPENTGAILLKQAQAQQATVTRLEGEVAETSRKVKELSGTPGQSGGTDDPGTDLLTSVTAVTGPGLTVTLQDARDTALDGRSNTGMVRDQDIRLVLNSLWGSGAEAISVNGHRIGPGTFVRTAGSTILVNVTAVQSPYRIEAIGDADALRGPRERLDGGLPLGTPVGLRHPDVHLVREVPAPRGPRPGQDHLLLPRRPEQLRRLT